MKNLPFILQQITENVDIGVLVLNPMGLVISANSSWACFTGRTEVELQANNYLTIIRGSYHPLEENLLTLFEPALKGYEVSSTHFHFHLGQEGFRDFEFRIKIVRDDLGKVQWIIGFLKDESNIKQLEQAVFQSEKCVMLSQLAAGAAHEIKNPLTSVRGFIQLLQREFTGTPKEDYLKIMIEEIDRVNKIAEGFLLMARPVQPVLRAFGVKDIIQEVVMLVESEARLREININMEANNNLPPVLVDKEQIKQVLINLFRNAFEAMPQGGNLSLRITRAGYKINIILMDQGIGMDAYTLKRVSEPFFTTKEKGTGLGLAICMEIIKNHRGRLVIRSKPKRGTNVLLQFPANIRSLADKHKL